MLGAGEAGAGTGAAARAGGGAISTLRLARLLAGMRLRLLRNLLRHRRSARAASPSPAFALVMAIVTSAAYVGLFTQSFGAIVASTDPAGQTAALSLIVGVILLGTLAGKAASGDAVLAGSPENEFLLSRPTSMASLVVARSLAGAVIDPFGALFIFPVLVAAAITWRLGVGAWVVAALTSVAVQIAVSAAAQMVQIAVVRYARPARRRLVWMGLRLGAALTLAVLWMTGTWVLRAPRALAAAVAPWREVIAWTPGAALVRPIAALRLGQPVVAVAALATLALAAGALVALAAAFARRAGMHGWEEAGAPWAEASPPKGAFGGVGFGFSAPITAGTKDLRLIGRDRSQLLALVAAPIIFVGIQIFGAVGWGWSTASLHRVAVLTFSMCLYMATLGPLVHMQAERRCFWILRTAPIPIGRLMLAKARTWALVLGALAAASFLALSAGVAGASAGDRVVVLLWVAVGAGGMAFIAVALGCQAADLSDEQRTAIGPGTIYLFLLVGALYNVVLGESGPARWRWLALYLFVGLSLWSSGMKQAEDCLDPEAGRHRTVRLGDAAVLALLSALMGRAVVKGAELADEQRAMVVGVAALAVGALLGIVAAIYLLRRRASRAPARLRLAPSLAIGLLVGGGAALALRGQMPALPLEIALATLPSILAEELIFRGTLQRALEQTWSRRRAGVIAAALVTLAIACLATPGPLLAIAAMHAVASALRAATGRTSTSFVARATVLLTLLALP